jgi:hypothetical protein
MKQFLENLNKYWVTPAVAIVGALLGIYFTIVKESLDASATRIETQLKEREFNNALKFQMYSEVKDAILKKDAKVQGAVLLIVNEMLASDSTFRDKLITLMLASPNIDTSVVKQQKEIDNKAEQFKLEEEQVKGDQFTIDVFYLEDIAREAEPRAERIVTLLKERYTSYQIRKRKLPRNINAQTGYRISANEIRYDPEEENLAAEIKTYIQSKGVFQLEQPMLRKTTRHTPKYLSIFVRNM